MGLFYSAFTHLVGLKPNEEEYIFMGMAGYGEPKYKQLILDTFFDCFAPPKFKLSFNLQKGCKWWDVLDIEKDKFDIAASVQSIYEDYLIQLVEYVSKTYKSKNLVLMGGNALNCVANTKVVNTGLWNDVWIFPNPGDAGNSLGSVLGYLTTYRF